MTQHLAPMGNNRIGMESFLSERSGEYGWEVCLRAPIKTFSRLFGSCSGLASY